MPPKNPKVLTTLTTTTTTPLPLITGSTPLMQYKETARRLRLLIDKLMSVPPDRIDMATWCSRDPDETPLPELKVAFTRLDAGDVSKVKRVEEHTCGTSACALGWATTIPELNLHLHAVTPFTGALVLYLPADPSDPQYGLRSFAAASAAFGITDVEAEDIFGVSQYRHRSPHYVKQRVLKNLEDLVWTYELASADREE